MLPAEQSRIHACTLYALTTRKSSLFLTTGFLVAIVYLVVAQAPLAQAFYQPDYQNRANTNFLDAYVPKQGLLLQTYLYHYRSHDLRGGKSITDKFDLSVNVTMLQACYISTRRVLGGFAGGEMILPFAHGHVETDRGRDSDSGAGDMFVGGFIQSDEKRLNIRDCTFPFYWRIAAGTFLPTGSYDHERLFNVGSNLFTYHLYNSWTVFLQPSWTVSWRFMYNVHSKNDEFGPQKDDLRPGQLFNVHFSSAYHLWKGVRAGMVGHYWLQTTDDKINGNRVRGREKALALGPGILASRTMGNSCITLFLHALFDAHTKNRSKGTTYQVRVAVGF